MKKGHMGLAILAGILAVCIFAGVFMKRQHQPLARTLGAASELAAAGEWEEAKTLAQRAREIWEEHWHGLAAFADHDPMEEIDSLFHRLEVYGKLEEQVAFAAVCEELSGKMEDMAEAHGLNWWNFL